MTLSLSSAQSSASIYTYDQQAVPGSPAINQTWLERNANGTQKEIWVWNGTYWLTFTPQITAVGTSQSGFTGQSSGPWAAGFRFDSELCSFVLVEKVTWHTMRISGTHDASNYYTTSISYRAMPNQVGGGRLGDNISLASPNLITTGTRNFFVTNPNFLFDLQMHLRAINHTPTGTPGELDVAIAVTARGVRR